MEYPLKEKMRGTMLKSVFFDIAKRGTIGQCLTMERCPTSEKSWSADFKSLMGSSPLDYGMCTEKA